MRAVLAAIVVGGCFTPTPPTGAACAAGTECPSPLVCSPATHTCELAGVAIDAAIADTVDAIVDVGIDAPPPTFLYRRRITIKNQTSATLPAGLTIHVDLKNLLPTLLSQAKVRTDFADLRVIGDGTLGERDRIVDPTTGPVPAGVSFALAQPIAANLDDSSYALYYGAPNATGAPANGTNVFAIYDDFTNGISNVWKKNDGPTTSGGMLVLRAGHTDALTTTATSDNLPIVSAVEVLARVVDPTSAPTTQPEGTFYYWFGYQHTGDFAASEPWIVWIARAANEIGPEQKSPTGCETGCNGPMRTQDTAFHFFTIERDTGASQFYLDGSQTYTSTLTTNSEDYSVMVRNYMATSDVEIDWIRARVRVAKDPQINLGGEEQL